MPAITLLTFGYLGGIALPQDPVPVRPVNPDDLPEITGPIKWPWTTGAPDCKICRGIIGSLSTLAVLQIFAPALSLNGFAETATMAAATGAVGSSLIGGVIRGLRKK